MAIRMNVPCRNCKEREEGCHSKCERYSAFKEEVERIRKTEKKAKANMSLTFMAKYYN